MLSGMHRAGWHKHKNAGSMFPATFQFWPAKQKNRLAEPKVQPTIFLLSIQTPLGARNMAGSQLNGWLLVNWMVANLHQNCCKINGFTCQAFLQPCCFENMFFQPLIVFCKPGTGRAFVRETNHYASVCKKQTQLVMILLHFLLLSFSPYCDNLLKKFSGLPLINLYQITTQLNNLKCKLFLAGKYVIISVIILHI